MQATPISVGEAVARARRLAADGRRRLLGITGPPGCGKSTLADVVADELSGRAGLVGMDGFHLAQAELVRLGRQDRKGALDTFDGAGYVALLRRLRDADGGRRVRTGVPARDRGAGQRRGRGAARVPLVITEGNYLLVDDGPWAQVRDLLDEAWFVVQDEDRRLDC